MPQRPCALQPDGRREGSLTDVFSVRRESEITGDKRCKEKFACNLTILEAKYAFLNSQRLGQMSAAAARR